MNSSTLDRTPTEVISQIVDLVESDSPSSVYRLLFVKPFRSLAESVIYKEVSLGGTQQENTLPWYRTKNMIDRIMNPKDVASSLVKSLVIQEWSAPLVQGFDDALLEGLLRSIQNLESFSWHSTYFIPKNVLALFHSRFPDARLCAQNLARGKTKERDEMALDVDLLTSPQLFSLKYVFLNQYEFDEPFRSELPLIPEMIKSSKKLRVLHLDCEGNGLYDFLRHSDAYRRFHPDFEELGRGPKDLSYRLFAPGERIQPLRELKFLSSPYRIGNSYSFSQSQLKLWRTHMDWSNLRILDLGGQAAPASFFEVFNGVVPNLKSLRFTLAIGGFGQMKDASLVEAFVDSIDALEEICITNATDGFLLILGTLVEKHGPTLRTFKTYRIKDAKWMWTAPDIVYLLESCPFLNELSIDVAEECYESPNDNGSGLNWPHLSLAFLSNPTNLRTLSIRTLVTSPIPTPVFPIEQIRDFTTLSFTRFFTYNSRATLRKFEVEITKSDPSLPDGTMRRGRIAVRRKERDDARISAYGGYDVHTILGIKVEGQDDLE